MPMLEGVRNVAQRQHIIRQLDKIYAIVCRLDNATFKSVPLLYAADQNVSELKRKIEINVLLTDIEDDLIITNCYEQILHIVKNLVREMSFVAIEESRAGKLFYRKLLNSGYRLKYAFEAFQARRLQSKLRRIVTTPTTKVEDKEHNVIVADKSNDSKQFLNLSKELTSLTNKFFYCFAMVKSGVRNSINNRNLSDYEKLKIENENLNKTLKELRENAKDMSQKFYYKIKCERNKARKKEAKRLNEQHQTELKQQRAIFESNESKLQQKYLDLDLSYAMINTKLDLEQKNHEMLVNAHIGAFKAYEAKVSKLEKLYLQEKECTNAAADTKDTTFAQKQMTAYNNSIWHKCKNVQYCWRLRRSKIHQQKVGTKCLMLEQKLKYVYNMIEKINNLLVKSQTYNAENNIVQNLECVLNEEHLQIKHKEKVIATLESEKEYWLSKYYENQQDLKAGEMRLRKLKYISNYQRIEIQSLRLLNESFEMADIKEKQDLRLHLQNELTKRNEMGYWFSKLEEMNQFLCIEVYRLRKSEKNLKEENNLLRLNGKLQVDNYLPCLNADELEQTQIYESTTNNYELKELYSVTQANIEKESMIRTYAVENESTDENAKKLAVHESASESAIVKPTKENVTEKYTIDQFNIISKLVELIKKKIDKLKHNNEIITQMQATINGYTEDIRYLQDTHQMHVDNFKKITEIYKAAILCCQQKLEAEMEQYKLQEQNYEQELLDARKELSATKAAYESVRKELLTIKNTPNKKPSKLELRKSKSILSVTGAPKQSRSDDTVSNDSVSMSRSNCCGQLVKSKVANASTKRGATFGDKRLNLLKWCNQRTRAYQINITDFSNSWKSGLAFCAIIHSYKPDLFAFNERKAHNDKQNLQFAENLAKKMGIKSNNKLTAICSGNISFEKIMNYIEQLRICLENNNDNSEKQLESAIET